MIIRPLLCENGPWYKVPKSNSSSEQGKATTYEGLCVISCHLNMITSKRKNGLAFLTTLHLQTLLCSISSFSNQGSLVLIYQNDSQPSEEKLCHRRRKGVAAVADHPMYCHGSCWSGPWPTNFPCWLQTCLVTMDLPGDPWAMPGPCSPHQTWSWSWLEDWLMGLTSDLLHYHTLACWPGLWAALPPLPALLPGWGWWDRPWLARSCPAGHSIPPLSSWLPSLTEQLALMPARKNLTCECIQDTKTISKKNFGLYLPQVISRAYLWTLPTQQKTQEPKDVQSSPSGSHLIRQPGLHHQLYKERCVEFSLWMLSWG